MRSRPCPRALPSCKRTLRDTSTNSAIPICTHAIRKHSPPRPTLWRRHRPNSQRRKKHGSSWKSCVSRLKARDAARHAVLVSKANQMRSRTELPPSHLGKRQAFPTCRPSASRKWTTKRHRRLYKSANICDASPRRDPRTAQDFATFTEINPNIFIMTAPFGYGEGQSVANGPELGD